MAHLIDKDVLVAEIKRKIRTEQGYNSGDAECGYQDCAREILSFINTLEVKEVDLDDKSEWKNTGGFGSTWDPDSPDYYPD